MAEMDKEIANNLFKDIAWLKEKVKELQQRLKLLEIEISQK